MKKILILFIVLSVFSSMGCLPVSDTARDVVVGNLINGEPVATIDITASEDEMASMGYTDLSNYGFIFSNASDTISFITWLGEDDGEEIIGASEIIITEDDKLILKANGDTHSCKSRGDCQGCRFVRGNDPNGNYTILGCQCQLGTITDGCTHTVTADTN